MKSNIPLAVAFVLTMGGILILAVVVKREIDARRDSEAIATGEAFDDVPGVRNLRVSSVADPTSPRRKPAGSEEPILTRWTLTDQTGREVTSESLAGEVQLVSFFFVSCPTTCQQKNALVQGLEREFGPKGVRFLSITCDPENDTPEVLARYASRLGAKPDRWTFLTGRLAYIRRVAAEVFGVALDRRLHVESMLLIDRSGKVRARLNWQFPDEMAILKRLMDKALDETPEQAAKQPEYKLPSLRQVEPGDETEDSASEPPASGDDAGTSGSKAS